ncbi:DUF2834 domain-containing protein [Chlorogloeopsis fritschii PCC 9212]|uniref:DUF2834 domain-containing protein n=1 Tax=Chlorogloeopsis fritschii PCC 6912 TaxID=211165 RepID=A0A433NNK2_CHLFR|nr:DUF2834 domain-containing protein [Chlorogloeopsis fritschii]RUR84932.1 hypothetical protein PCC6912_10480 [Chlorogloeopsis fritschii PCC 6912]
MLQGIYLILSILGLTLPYSQFISFLLEHGFDIKLFLEHLFANRISAFFGMDVFISALVLLMFVFWEGTRLKMKFLWVYIVSTLTVGVSFGLPLFLLMRQRQLEKQSNSLFST